jgi:hypothetical protein
MIVRNRRRFAAGIVGLASFFAVLAVWLSPVAGGRSGLAWADNFFNRLSKGSVYSLPELRRKAEGFRGRALEARFVVRGDPAASPSGQPAEDARKAAQVAAFLKRALPGEDAAAGTEIAVAGAEVRVSGDLGGIAQVLLTDAEPLYHNRDEGFQERYGLGGREALYWYWVLFGDAYKRYVGRTEIEAANFASAMRTKVCEPIYNFSGIAPTRAGDVSGQLVFLLAFYILYTVWFGFSILLLFEGMGIDAHRAKRRET